MHMRINRLHLVASLVFGLTLSATLMPPSALAQGTAEQRAACEGDASRVCGQYMPDVQRITACMRRNCGSLSPRCRAVMKCGKRRR